MTTFLTVVHVITCSLLVLVVLIQSGKGAEISASFGGSSQTVFGSSGGANFFSRFTAGAATVFMVTSIALTVLGSRGRESVFSGQPAVPSAPTAPAQAPNPPSPVDVPNQTAPAGNAQSAPSGR